MSVRRHCVYIANPKRLHADTATVGYTYESERSSANLTEHNPILG